MKIKTAEAMLLLFVALGIVILVLVGISPARAERAWPNSEFSQHPVGHRYERLKPYRTPRKRKRNYTHGTHPQTVVKAWRKLDGFQDNRHCKEIVEAVGQRRANNDRALDDVKENWHQIVVSKYGVMFADIENARQVTDACVSVSRPGVLSNTSEILTREKLQDRQCILKARPCGPKESK